MSALPVARGPDGRILPGHSGNPSGRPVGSISEFRARFEPHMAEVAETLLALMRSPNESTRLSACREILDRVLGRAAIAIDATHTKGATSHKRQQFSRMVQYLRKSGSVVHKDVVGTPLNLQRGCGSQSVARQ